MAPAPPADDKKDEKMSDVEMASVAGGDEYPPFENDEKIAEKVTEVVEGYKSASEGKRNLEGTIEKLLQLERVNRGAGASPEVSLVCVSVVRLLGEVERDYKRMGEYVTMLSKRRAQLKMAIQRMVKEAMRIMSTYVEGKDEKTMVELLEVLREVTAGKIFVELERARLTRMLSDIKIKNGDVEGAASIMQQVQVETFSGMERHEKYQFILEQVRLCLETKDFIRAQIISKKILPRQINKYGTEEADTKDKDKEKGEKEDSVEKMRQIKLDYYSTMIRIHTHNEDYINICISYLERFYTVEKVASDAAAWRREIELACFFILLSVHDSQQADLLQRIRTIKQVSDADDSDAELKRYKDLLTKFSTHQLISWPQLLEEYGTMFEHLANVCVTETFASDLKWKPALQARVTEHNLRTLAKYYSRIYMSRLAQLLDMSESDTERKLAAMVSDKKSLWAKIDRPNRIVSFAKPQDADSVLNNWADNVTSLLDTVEKTCHLVHRETMVHAIDANKKQ